jgi:hypothetical protein
MSWSPPLSSNRDDEDKNNNNNSVIVSSSDNVSEEKQNTYIEGKSGPTSVVGTSGGETTTAASNATPPQQNNNISMSKNGVDLTAFMSSSSSNNRPNKNLQDSVLQVVSEPQSKQEQTLVTVTPTIVPPVVEESEYVTPSDLLVNVRLIDYIFPEDSENTTTTNNIVSPMFQVFQNKDTKGKGQEWITLREKIKGKKSILLNEACKKQSITKDAVEKKHETIRKTEELIEKKQKNLKKKEFDIKFHKGIVETKKKEMAAVGKKDGVKDESNNKESSGWTSTLGNLFSSTSNNNDVDDDDVDDDDDDNDETNTDKEKSKKKMNKKKNTEQDKLKEKTTASETRLNMVISEKELIEEDIVKLNNRLEEAKLGLIQIQKASTDAVAMVEEQKNMWEILNNEADSILESCGVKDFAAASSFDINKSRDERGLSLFLISVLENDVSNVSFFLSIGADPNEAVGAVTPILVASYFKLSEMMELLMKNGGSNSASIKKDNFLKVALARGISSATQHMQDWEGTGKVADQASIPIDDLMEKALELESSLESRMPILTSAEQKLHLEQCGFYDSSLVNVEQHRHAMRRAILLEKSVLQWLQSPVTEIVAKETFASFLIALSRKDNTIPCDRKSIVGFSNP